MLDVLLFGATGYTGRLVAASLARRGASFAVAGRDRAGLEQVAERTGAAAVRVAAVGNVHGLVEALQDVRVLLTCVGPFSELGDTAVEAALSSGVGYVDATGEAAFVARLVRERHETAKAAGIAMAPALGFDEGPADVAATLATGGMADAQLTITYALPSRASPGTVGLSLHVLTAPGWWLRDGRRVPVASGASTRWAPMPPPLGPRPSVSSYMAESELAPLHLDVADVSTYLTTGTARRVALKFGLPVLRRVVAARAARRAVEAVMLKAVDAPDRSQPGRWTILAEACAGSRRRNVVMTGDDVYGLTAELLATGALELARHADGRAGVLAPVQAVGPQRLQEELEAHGVTIETFDLH
ncbi:MAG: hypothetical protein ABR529_15050 [Actinomycetota bacterium]